MILTAFWGESTLRPQIDIGSWVNEIIFRTSGVGVRLCGVPIIDIDGYTRDDSDWDDHT